MSENTSQVQVQPVDKAKVRKIWKTAGILAFLTAIEFVVAFAMGPGTLKVAIFIGLTIFKAFYIVAEFMHLKYEVKVLIWSILIPMIFVIWMLIAFIYEGASLYDVKY